MAVSRRAATLASVLAAACTLGLVFAQSAEAVWPGDNGKIVFYRAITLPSGQISAQIYSMSSQGGEQTNLSAAGGGADQLDIQPSVSPNGKRIAFTRVDPTTLAGQIWTMKMDGSDQTDVSNDLASASETGPAWTEDGSSILFVRQSAGSPIFGGSGSIWIRRANGKGTPRQVTSGPVDANPAMSPDGDLIAFSRINFAEGARHLIVMKADGSGAPMDLGQGSKPDWSPDSKRLVYGQGGMGPIMVVKISDPSSKQVLAGIGNEAPVWSPDGSQIAFLQCAPPPTGVCQIALMTATGQNQHAITSDPTVGNNKPDWQRVNGEGGQHGG
jgi:Tol biopolymer transport system component